MGISIAHFVSLFINLFLHCIDEFLVAMFFKLTKGTALLTAVHTSLPSLFNSPATTTTRILNKGSANIFLNLEQKRYRAEFAPRKTKYRKAHKGRVPVRIGGSTKGNTIAFGEYGIRVKDGVRLSSAQLTAARDALK